MRKAGESNLPIQDVLQRIHAVLSASNQLVLQAEPGAGKSTALPLSVLKADWLQGQKIIMLEPRRVAAKSIAHFLAKQLGEKVGQRVGYQIKNDKKTSSQTRLEIVTEGILTRRLQADPELTGTKLIIFDEFHERSLNSDLSLMLALEVQQTLRDDLKLLVMSATIDTKKVADYLGQAEVIHCPGRTYPVEVTYVASHQQKHHFLASHQRLIESVRSVLKIAAKESEGDILVFLPGQGDIARCMEAAKGDYALEQWILLPLFGGLSLTEQELALLPDKNYKRRIIFSTNIAETSLTINGITAVIDSGLEKNLVYDPASGMTRLETQRISKASAEQRAGRAGRTQAGLCFRLWSQEQQHTLNDYQPEEILTADLTGLLLELAEWGSMDYESLHWLTPPPRVHFASALATLKSLHLLDDSGHLTELGRKATDFGLSPRLSAMLLQAQGEKRQSIACELAALLAERDIFYGPNGVDITDRLLALQTYQYNKKQASHQYPIKRSVAEQCWQSANAYKSRLKLKKSAISIALADIQTIIGHLLLMAFPDRLAKRRTKGSGRYLLANGRGAFLPEQDALFGTEWLVIADCDGQKREGRIFQAVPVSDETVRFAIKGATYEKIVFSIKSDKEKISGEKQTFFGSLQLASAPVQDIPPEVFEDCVRQSIKDMQFQLFNWDHACGAWLTRVEWLGRYIDHFPVITKSSLLASVDDWLLPYIADATSVNQLKKLNLLELLKSQLNWDEQTLLDKEAPAEYTTPGGRRVPIIYDCQQGPMISIPLQEMFGQVTSPRIALGKVALRFELLSPAKRPLQTTSDLEHFWKSSYFEVAKEMRGRYPKHRWPEEPLKEQPGRSIKRRPQR